MSKTKLIWKLLKPKLALNWSQKLFRCIRYFRMRSNEWLSALYHYLVINEDATVKPRIWHLFVKFDKMKIGSQTFFAPDTNFLFY